MSSNDATLSLFEMEYNTTYSISHINEEFFQSNTLRRLAELGFRTGVPITALQRTSGNGRLVTIDSARYALDKKSTRNIFVTEYQPRVVEEITEVEKAPGCCCATHEEAQCCCCKDASSTE